MRGFAHRGASSDYPENTLLAFEKALEIGVQGMELDVQMSKDGYLAIIHDESVERTFEGQGQVEDLTLEELQALVPRRVYFRDNPKCRVCTLEDVLQLLQNYPDVWLNIELKTDEVEYIGIEEKVIQAIHTFNLQDRVLLSSFNHETLKRCKAIALHIKVGALQHTPDDYLVTKSVENGFDAIHPYVGWVTEELVKEAHIQGLEVNTYTVNEPCIMRSLDESKVDGIFTDDPQLFKEVIGTK